MKIPTFKLNNDMNIPCVGLGIPRVNSQLVIENLKSKHKQSKISFIYKRL